MEDKKPFFDNRMEKQEIIYSTEENDKLYQLLEEHFSNFFKYLSQKNSAEVYNNFIKIKQLLDSNIKIPLKMILNEELCKLYCHIFQSNNLDIINNLAKLFCIVENNSCNFLKEIPNELIVIIFNCLEHFSPNDSLSMISLISNIINANKRRKYIFIPLFPRVFPCIFQKIPQREDIICLRQIIQCLPFNDPSLPQIISYLSHCCTIPESSHNSYLVSYSFITISEFIEDNLESSEQIIGTCKANNLFAHASSLMENTTEGNILRAVLTFFSVCMNFLQVSDILSIKPSTLFDLLVKYSNIDIRFSVLRLIASLLAIEKVNFEIPNEILSLLIEFCNNSEFQVSNASFRILCFLMDENKIPNEYLFDVANTIFDHADYLPEIVYNTINEMGKRFTIKGEKDIFEKWLEEKDWISFLDIYEFDPPGQSI